MLATSGGIFKELTPRQAILLADDKLKLIQTLQRAGVLRLRCKCSKCGDLMVMQRFESLEDGYIWRCKKCKTRRSCRHESYFQNHKLPLSKAFLLIYFYLKYDKMLSKYICEFVEVTENTMVDWGCYIRESISHYFLETPLILGQNHPVQIDESLFGGKMKYNVGNHCIHQKSWVFGLVEEVTNLCVFWKVDDRRKETLFNVIKDHVVTGSTIKSDQFSSYQTLNVEGYSHLQVNHSVNFVSEEGVHTQLIESHWGQLKEMLKIKRGTTADHLAGYLDLYSFRCMAKYQNVSILDAFFQIIQVNNHF